MTIHLISETYEQTVGAFVHMLREHAGQEPGDPAKIAEVVTRLPEMEEPPLRLLMGSDAVAYANAAQQVRAASDAKWRHLSESVNFDSNAAKGSTDV